MLPTIAGVMRWSVVVAFVIGLAAVGCGGPRTEGTPVDGRLGDVIASTTEAGTARIRVETEWSLGEKQTLIMVVDGVTDLRSGATRGESAASWEGMEVPDGLPQRRTRFLVVYGTTFVEEAADQWVRYDTPQGTTGPGDLGYGRADKILDALADTGEVEHLGRTEIDGAPVDHYRVSSSLPSVAAPDAGTDAPGETATAQPSPTGQTADVDVWVTDDRRIRRLRVDLDLDGSEYRMVTIVDLTDFGVPLDLTPPPADQVIDATDRSRQERIERAGADPAPAGERPEGLPDSVPAEMPIPAGATVVEADGDKVVLRSTPPAGVDPATWFQRIQLLFDLELDRPERRIMPERRGAVRSLDHRLWASWRYLLAGDR